MRSMLLEGRTLRPTARTLWEIQQFACKPPVETSTNLYIDLLRRTEAALQQGKLRRSSVTDAASLHHYQQEVKHLFLSCIGGLPPKSDPSSARVTGRCDYKTFTLEKILLSPEKDTLVSTNLYLPSQPVQNGPAVLIVVGHSDPGKADPEYQYLAQAFAHAGITALVMDPFGEGERFEHYEAEMDFQPIQGCSGEHDLMDWKCKLLGQSLARYFVRDGLAALDYLASRPEVDPARIGLTGHSGGGTQTCMLMLAAGDRFACAAPCCYTTDVKAMMERGVDPDNEMTWPGNWSKGLDYIDFIAGMAPKPVLFLTVQHDFFPREGTKRTLAEARQLWQRLNAPVLPEMATAQSQHSYTNYLSRTAAEFFSRQLTGQQADLSSFAFHCLPDKELWCTPDGILPKAYPEMRTLHQQLLEELAQCKKRRNALTSQEKKAKLTEALHLERLDTAPEAMVAAEGVCGHYVYRKIAWQPEQGFWNTGMLLRDMRQGDKPLPTVVALWPEGLARIAEHSNWIYRTIRNGWQVLIMDVTASGSLLPSDLGHSGLYIGWGTMFKLNAYLMQLNDCLFALRTRQVIAAVKMLSLWDEAQPGALCLYAERECSRMASLAAYMTDLPLCADSNFQSYEEIVTERYQDQTNTHEWIFPSALNFWDAVETLEELSKIGLQSQSPADVTPADACVKQ